MPPEFVHLIDRHAFWRFLLDRVGRLRSNVGPAAVGNKTGRRAMNVRPGAVGKKRRTAGSLETH
jgi:hypothetical protein